MKYLIPPLPPAPRPELDCPFDDPVHGPEWSVRIQSVMVRNGYKTLREVANDFERIQKLKGLGRKSFSEMAECIRYACREQKSLFEDPEYRRLRFEDKLGTADALMADVQRTLLRVALRGRVSEEQRRHIAYKLRDAALQIEQLPLNGDD